MSEELGTKDFNDLSSFKSLSLILFLALWKNSSRLFISFFWYTVTELELSLEDKIWVCTIVVEKLSIKIVDNYTKANNKCIFYNL